MVPMAPSSTRMRDAARSRSRLRALGWDGVGISGCLFGCGAQAQQVADRVYEVGAVHGVEVKVGDAALDQIEHLFGRDRSRDQLAGRDVVIKPVKPLGEPARHRGAAARGEILGLLE